jgi:hypothetical protein
MMMMMMESNMADLRNCIVKCWSVNLFFKTYLPRKPPPPPN